MLKQEISKEERERIRFFENFYQYCGLDAGFIEVRGIANGKGVVDQQWFNDVTEMCNYVESKADGCTNYYFGVCTRTENGGSKQDVVEIPCLWIDIDFKDSSVKEAVQAVKQFPIRPTTIIHSGGGLHVYWRLKEPLTIDDQSPVESHLRRLAISLNGDLQAAEIARILRIPNTVNFKYPKLVKILYESNFEYELSDFEDFLPDEPKREENDIPEWDKTGFIERAYSKEYTEGQRNGILMNILKYYANHLAPEDVLFHVWNFAKECIEPDPSGKYNLDYIKERVKWAVKNRRCNKIKRTCGISKDKKFRLIETWVPEYQCAASEVKK